MKIYLKAYFHWPQLLRIFFAIVSFMGFLFANIKGNIFIQGLFIFFFLYLTYEYADGVKQNLAYLNKEKEKVR